MRNLFFILFLLFSGCSTKEYHNNLSKIIIIKSPKIKFSDLGFVRYTDSNIEIELFIAGKAVKNIAINHLICVDEGCMSKNQFNANFLNANYPENLLQNIFLGKEIFSAQNKILQKNGFIQHIQSKYYNIDYKIDKHSIFFKDKQNHIIIKIKDIS